MTKQITVQRIISPKPGGKQYKVVDTSGQEYGVFQEAIGNYTVGGTYNILKEQSRPFNGKTYTTLYEVEFVTMSNGASSAPSAQPQPSTVRQFPQRANSAQANPNITPRSQYDANKDLHIFVCGAINNILCNPNVQPMELNAQQIIAVIGNLTTAWRNTLGKEQRDDGMNDQVPDFFPPSGGH